MCEGGTNKDGRRKNRETTKTRGEEKREIER